MSKKKKRKRAQPTGRNRHHLLFQARYWNKGMAKVLRGYFVYYLPIGIHNELHNYIIHDIPKPPPDALKTLYMAFEAEKAELDHLDVIEALKWLQKACDYEPFRAGIIKQAEFLERKIGHN